MSVAVTNSPVFSPSIAIPKSPAEFRIFNSARSPSPSSSSYSPSSCYSPSSPLRLSLPKAPPTAAVLNSSSPGGSVSKRKRPAMLDIPLAAVGFGGGEENQNQNQNQNAAAEVDEVERAGDGYSVFCKRGRRKYMEDRFSAVADIHGDPKQAFFGVFDGHSGAMAAEFAAENLGKNILDRISTGGGEIEDAITRGYLDTDSQFLKQEKRSGSCCVTALIRDGKLIVSNAGDCRAVLSRSGVAEPLTSDHRPGREDERARIESTGGYVDKIRGVWRIQGSLAVSRGIGDGHLKQWVIAEPETRTVEIEPELEFLILGSDGLWGKVGNQEAVDIVGGELEKLQKQPLMDSCKKLAEMAVSRGSSDNVTVMLIELGRWRNLTDE